MEGQQSLSAIECGMRKRKTKPEAFLDEMEIIINWDKWCDIIESFYYNGIYDIYAFRKFVGINFAEEQVPDSTPLKHFRKFLEDNNNGEPLFSELNASLEEAGLMYRGSTIVYAIIIPTPSSTKNKKSRGTLRYTRPGRATKGISE